MNDNQETVTVELNIPTRIYLYGRRPLEETKEIAAQHLRNQANAIFSFIAYGSELVQSDAFDEKIYHELCGVLGKIGGDLLDAIELVELDRGKHLENSSLPAARVARIEPPETKSVVAVEEAIEESFTEHLIKRMADRLIMVLESPDVPESAKDALFAIADNATENSLFVESRSEAIKNRFSEALLSFDRSRAHAALDSLAAVMENCIPSEVYSPIHEANMEKFK